MWHFLGLHRIDRPCQPDTSICRGLAKIFSGLWRFLGISVLLSAKRHISFQITQHRRYQLGVGYPEIWEEVEGDYVLRVLATKDFDFSLTARHGTPSTGIAVEPFRDQSDSERSFMVLSISRVFPI